MKGNKSTINHDRVAGLAILAGSALGLIYTANLYEEAAQFPRVVFGIIALCALLLLGRTFLAKHRKTSSNPFFIHLPRLLLITGLMLVYIILINRVGYYTVTLVFIPLTSWLLGFRRKLYIALTTLVYLLCVYVVFNYLFSMPFPPEFFQR